MNYKLAKQLKEAGFPQEGDNYHGFSLKPKAVYTEKAVYTAEVTPAHTENEKEFVYIPTLEELIDACGNEFGCLTYYKWTDISRRWEARDKRAREYWFVVGKRGNGKTPLEAVAKLWLKLNENN